MFPYCLTPSQIGYCSLWSSCFFLTLYLCWYSTQIWNIIIFFFFTYLALYFKAKVKAGSCHEAFFLTPSHIDLFILTISVALDYITLGCSFVTYGNLFHFTAVWIPVSHTVLTGYKFNRSIIFLFNWNEVMNLIFPIKICFPHYYETLILWVICIFELKCDSLTCFMLFLTLHSTWFAHRMG